MTARGNLLPNKWELIALFWCAFFFNQADRQVYSVVLVPLSAELHLSSEQAGLIGSIFMWTYAILVPVAGYAGDVLRRKWIVFWIRLRLAHPALPGIRPRPAAGGQGLLPS